MLELDNYDPGEFYDEWFSAQGQPRPFIQPLLQRVRSLPAGELQQRQKMVQQVMFNIGATFTVYGAAEGTERIMPFDILPRVIPASEWQALERGLKQRIAALNTFLADVYGEQKIIRDGVIPRELIESAKGYLRPCHDLTPPAEFGAILQVRIWCAIAMAPSMF